MSSKAEVNLDEMWARLATHQPWADQRGYGKVWARMCELRTEEAALAAARAAGAKSVWMWAAMAAENAADAVWAKSGGDEK